MKSYHSQVNGWNWRTYLSEVNQVHRPKTVCSPSYVDFGSRKNAVVLLDLGHTLSGECIWEEWG
jgi:hypothetical protein